MTILKCDSREEAILRVEQVTKINAAANWEMHSWESKDPTIFKNFDNYNNTENFIKNSYREIGEKMLGLRWFNTTDELAFNINSSKIDKYNEITVPTKREFLSIIMSIFDPLGFLTPFTLESRILIQNVWISKIGWDEKLQDNEFCQWKNWLKDLKSVSTCRISRCYLKMNN